MIGPAVEPFLSEHQAAKQGRDCGTNITRAFAHLDPEAPGCETGDVPEELWETVLGPAAPAIRRLCA
eukprot:3843988-Lingulodinium_polyedra.AAC.1